MKEKHEISLEGLPRGLQEKIVEILGTDTLPVKKTTLREILPDLDLPKDKVNAILKVLDPKNVERIRQEEINHNRLEEIMNKHKGKVKPESPKIQILRDELERRKHK